MSPIQKTIKLAYPDLYLPVQQGKARGMWKLRPVNSPETPNFSQDRWCSVPCDLQIWTMSLANNRASILCCFMLCATFHSHRWIHTGVTGPETPNVSQIRRFLELCDLEIWKMTSWKIIGHLFNATGIFDALFRSHWWFQTLVTVRKLPNLD